MPDSNPTEQILEIGRDQRHDTASKPGKAGGVQPKRRLVHLNDKEQPQPTRRQNQCAQSPAVAQIRFSFPSLPE